MHSKLIQKDDRKANLILLEIIQRLFGYELSKKRKEAHILFRIASTPKLLTEPKKQKSHPIG